MAQATNITNSATMQNAPSFETQKGAYEAGLSGTRDRFSEIANNIGTTYERAVQALDALSENFLGTGSRRNTMTTGEQTQPNDPNTIIKEALARRDSLFTGIPNIVDGQRTIAEKLRISEAAPVKRAWNLAQQSANTPPEELIQQAFQEKKAAPLTPLCDKLDTLLGGEPGTAQKVISLIPVPDFDPNKFANAPNQGQLHLALAAAMLHDPNMLSQITRIAGENPPPSAESKQILLDIYTSPAYTAALSQVMETDKDYSHSSLPTSYKPKELEKRIEFAMTGGDTKIEPDKIRVMESASVQDKTSNMRAIQSFLKAEPPVVMKGLIPTQAVGPRDARNMLLAVVREFEDNPKMNSVQAINAVQALVGDNEAGVKMRALADLREATGEPIKAGGLDTPERFANRLVRHATAKLIEEVNPEAPEEARRALRIQLQRGIMAGNIELVAKITEQIQASALRAEGTGAKGLVEKRLQLIEQIVPQLLLMTATVADNPREGLSLVTSMIQDKNYTKMWADAYTTAYQKEPNKGFQRELIQIKPNSSNRYATERQKVDVLTGNDPRTVRLRTDLRRALTDMHRATGTFRTVAAIKHEGAKVIGKNGRELNPKAHKRLISRIDREIILGEKRRHTTDKFLWFRQKSTLRAVETRIWAAEQGVGKRTFEKKAINETAKNMFQALAQRRPKRLGDMEELCSNISRLSNKGFLRNPEDRKRALGNIAELGVSALVTLAIPGIIAANVTFAPVIVPFAIVGLAGAAYSANRTKTMLKNFPELNKELKTQRKLAVTTGIVSTALLFAGPAGLAGRLFLDAAAIAYREIKASGYEGSKRRALLEVTSKYTAGIKASVARLNTQQQQDLAQIIGLTPQEVQKSKNLTALIMERRRELQLSGQITPLKQFGEKMVTYLGEKPAAELLTQTNTALEAATRKQNSLAVQALAFQSQLGLTKLVAGLGFTTFNPSSLVESFKNFSFDPSSIMGSASEFIGNITPDLSQLSNAPVAEAFSNVSTAMGNLADPGAYIKETAQNFFAQASDSLSAIGDSTRSVAAAVMTPGNVPDATLASTAASEASKSALSATSSQLNLLAFHLGTNPSDVISTIGWAGLLLNPLVWLSPNGISDLISLYKTKKQMQKAATTTARTPISSTANPKNNPTQARTPAPQAT